MTTIAPPAAVTSHRTCFIALGVTQLVAAFLVGLLWLLAGIAVAGCTDYGSAATCGHATRAWLGTGAALALNVVAAITMLATAGRSIGTWSRRIVCGLCAGAAVLFLVV